MLNERELQGLDRDLTSFRVSSSEHHDKLQELVTNYAQLLEDYTRLKSDLEEEKETREKYKKLARGSDRNPFVLVLIDGDNYIFDDALVATGSEGGARAANMLNAAIKDRLLRLGHDVANARIMVRIYTNLGGLSKALARVGLAGHEARSLAPFTASFTQSQDLFDFVDVGDKNRNVDLKIGEMFRLFAGHSQCKHIFFAGCNDNSHLPMLAPYIGKGDYITLVRSTYMHSDFHSLKLAVTEFPTVFRSDPVKGFNDNIHNRSIPGTKSSLAKLSATQQSLSDAPSSAKVCSHYLKAACKYGSGCKYAHPAADSWRNGASNHRSSPSRDQDYPIQSKSSRSLLNDRAESTSSEVSAAVLLPRMTSDNEGMIPLNQDGHRLDFYRKPMSGDQWNAYQQRSKTRKLCNDWHLKGYCRNGDDCKYDHSSSLPQGLRYVLESLVHDYPCPRRGQCRRKNCFAGHICYKEDCLWGPGKGGCRLNRSMHGVDFNVARWVPAEVSSDVADTNDEDGFNTTGWGTAPGESGSNSTDRRSAPGDSGSNQKGWGVAPGDSGSNQTGWGVAPVENEPTSTGWGAAPSDNESNQTGWGVASGEIKSNSTSWGVPPPEEWTSEHGGADSDSAAMSVHASNSLLDF